MKLEQTFEVQAPLAQVWDALNDLERVAPCLPGAANTGHVHGQARADDRRLQRHDPDRGG